jgi:hypothetical protein
MEAGETGLTGLDYRVVYCGLDGISVSGVCWVSGHVRGNKQESFVGKRLVSLAHEEALITSKLLLLIRPARLSK